MTSRLIHFASSFATLLSNGGDGGSDALDNCRNATDSTCSAGYAAVSAYWRALGGEDQFEVEDEDSTNTNTTNTTTKLLLPSLDLYSPFVQMHPEGWAINRILLHDYFGYKAMIAPQSLIRNNLQKQDKLQTNQFPLVMTNVALSPSNAWQPYVKSVLFDDTTGLAVLFIVPQDEVVQSAGTTTGTGTTSFSSDAYFAPQIESALGALNYIAKVNKELQTANDQNITTTSTSTSSDESRIWIPVVLFAELSTPAYFQTFVTAMLNHTESPPWLIVDIQGNAVKEYATPTKLGSTWVCSFSGTNTQLHRFEIQLMTFPSQDIFSSSSHASSTPQSQSQSHPSVSVMSVALKIENLTDVTTVLDKQYEQDILHIHDLAKVAFLNNPVVGYSGYMPLTRHDDDGSSSSNKKRLCMGGECPIGNLFADALQWHAGADVAFVGSGGLRGPGWPPGPVRVSDLWDALPFANSVCTGRMLGIHLYDILQYSTSSATFLSTYTKTGDDLLQTSWGLRYTYNTKLPASPSRLIAVEVFNNATQSFEPLERLKLYSFATDSYFCSVAAAWIDLLTTNLKLKGESPGVVATDGLTHQLVVADFLSQNGVYNTTVQGRLRNDTSATEPLKFLQTEEECQNSSGNSTWDPDTETCADCPDQGGKVRFAQERLDFTLEVGQEDGSEPQLVELLNLETFPVRVVPKSIPSWMQLGSLPEGGMMESGDSQVLRAQVLTSPTPNEPGTALGTLLLAVLDGGTHPGCVGRDASLDILVRTIPKESRNQLEGFRYIGFSLSFVIVVLSVSFALWVGIHRKERIVKTLQPFFLIEICLGIMIIGCSLTTLSIDDQIVSADQVNVACMATPWLMAIGATFAFSALFSKLWRINRLFNSNFSRVQVTEKDVVWPIYILLLVNLILLFTWTFVDPLQWERNETAPGQPWNTYGVCAGGGSISRAMMALLLVVNFAALGLACWQAYRARSISDEFSEAKYMGIAVFSWFQVLAVGCPVIFLIDKQDTQTVYFLEVAIISIICSSMLLLIFVPPLIQWWRQRKRGAGDRGSRRPAHVAGMPRREDPSEARARASIVGPPATAAAAAATATAAAAAAAASEVQALQAKLSLLERQNDEYERENESLKRGRGRGGGVNDSSPVNDGNCTARHHRDQKGQEQGADSIVDSIEAQTTACLELDVEHAPVGGDCNDNHHLKPISLNRLASADDESLKLYE